MKRLLASSAFGLVLAVSGTADAGFILDAGGNNTGAIPLINDFDPTDPAPNLGTFGLAGLLKVYNNLSVNQDGTIEFFFHGKEAGFINGFTNGGSISFTQNADVMPLLDPGTSLGSYSVSAGDAFAGVWEFFSNSSGGVDASLGDVDFGIFTENASGSPVIDSNAVYFGYDDDGADEDNNHDDLIVSARFTAAPEPATLALLGAGLAGLGFAARRRRMS